MVMLVSNNHNSGQKPDFTIVTDTDVVPKLKWHYQSSRIYVTSRVSGRHRLLLKVKMADKKQK